MRTTQEDSVLSQLPAHYSLVSPGHTEAITHREQHRTQDGRSLHRPGSLRYRTATVTIATQLLAGHRRKVKGHTSGVLKGPGHTHFRLLLSAAAVSPDQSAAAFHSTLASPLSSGVKEDWQVSDQLATDLKPKRGGSIFSAFLLGRIPRMLSFQPISVEH